MAHYAFLDDNNIVIEVIAGRNETEIVNGVSDWEQYYRNLRNQICKRTSYNNNIRKNFAGIGYTYDETRDAFIPPKPFESWILNEETCLWEAPISYPNDNKIYNWNETTKEWIKM
jgi:sensor domain CHASE-containing protein